MALRNEQVHGEGNAFAVVIRDYTRDMTSGAAFLLGAVVGAGAGALGSHLLTSSGTAAPEGLHASVTRSVGSAPGPVLEAGRPADPPAARTAPERLPQPGDLHVGRDAFVATYRTTYRQQTGSEPTPAQEATAWDHFRSSTTDVPASLAAQAAEAELESRRRAEISDRDDIMAVLNDEKRSADVAALRYDPVALGKLLAHRAAHVRVDGPSTSRPDGEPLADGTVLRYPDGVFTVGEPVLMGRGRRMPRDLTLEGSSMDRTLLTLSDFSANDVVWNLHLKDLTIDCGNDGAFDLRAQKASIQAEDVRFVRFDAGHGGCYVFDLSRGGAVYCKNCRFEGGYGRSPGHGNIARSVTVARFEDCTFERITYKIDVPGSFVRCTFRDCPRMQDLISGSNAGVHAGGQRFEDCRTETTLASEASGSTEPPGRDLKSLFPAFRGR